MKTIDETTELSKLLTSLHALLDADDAMILEGVRQGQCPPLQEGLFCKAPQWETLWNL